MNKYLNFLNNNYFREMNHYYIEGLQILNKTKMRKVFDTNTEYHKHDSISASGLKTIYEKGTKFFVEEIRKQTSAMNFGTAVHVAVLEGEKPFFNEFHVLPKIDRRTKEGKNLYAEHLEKAGEKKLLTQDEFILIEEILKDLDTKDKKHIVPYLVGDKEYSHYGTFNEIDCRVRPDCINYDKKFISDVKTCQSTNPHNFRYDVFKWHYDLQACFYSDFLGFDPKDFKFITIMANKKWQKKIYRSNSTLEIL
jgi:hypothetical protein